ncbi:hypothetical protein CF8_0241 [Aeromonas phage CF8]|nr:hypothetical protein CF8_0241 [Aeromonas phage CF8]
MRVDRRTRRYLILIVKYRLGLISKQRKLVETLRLTIVPTKVTPIWYYLVREIVDGHRDKLNYYNAVKYSSVTHF